MLKFSPGIVALTLVLVPYARAELPPGSYDELRIKAQEALIIEVESVTTKEIKEGFAEVILEARIVAVERSKSRLKKGSKIMIRYESLDTVKVPVHPGPRPIPILKKGEFYPAFLDEKKGTREFEPAAAGESFHMTPDL